MSTPAGACFTARELAFLLHGHEPEVGRFDTRRLLLHLGCGCEGCWSAVDALPAGAGEADLRAEAELQPAGLALAHLRAPELGHLPPMLRAYAAEARRCALGFCFLYLEETVWSIRLEKARGRREDGSPPAPLAEGPARLASVIAELEQPALVQVSRPAWRDLMARAHAHLADALVDGGCDPQAREVLGRARRHQRKGTGEAELAATLLEVEARMVFLADGEGGRAVPLMARALKLLERSEPADRLLTAILFCDDILCIDHPMARNRIPRLESALDRLAGLTETVARQYRGRLLLHLADARLWRAFGLERIGHSTAAECYNQSGLQLLRRARTDPEIEKLREARAWCLLLQGLADHHSRPERSRSQLRRAVRELEAVGFNHRASLAESLLQMPEERKCLAWSMASG